LILHSETSRIGITGKNVLFEDNHLIIFNKRSSDIVQGDKTGDTPLSDLIKEYLKEKYEKPGNVFLGVVHRLDRPVSGAMVFARTSKALTRLNQMLKEGAIRKTYWAVVKSPPPDEEAVLTHYLIRNEKQNKSFVCDPSQQGSQEARLKYSVKGRSNRYWLLEIDLFTGRHHQIRAQLAAIGSPVKGDLKYGDQRSNPGGFIHLHSRRIELEHPVKKDLIRAEAPLPDDPVWNLFAPK